VDFFSPPPFVDAAVLNIFFPFQFYSSLPNSSSPRFFAFFPGEAEIFVLRLFLPGAAFLGSAASAVGPLPLKFPRPALVLFAVCFAIFLFFFRCGPNFVSFF